MADIEVIMNVEGLDELEATLIAGGKKAAKKFLRSVEKTAGKVFLAALEETVPVRTGALQEDIRMNSSVQGDTLTVRVGVGSDLNYIGRFAEFGTIHQPAQHWMQRAFEASKEDAFRTLIEEATESLNEIANK